MTMKRPAEIDESSSKKQAVAKPSGWNTEVDKIEVDHLYHLGLTSGEECRQRFHDVKLVCMHGSPVRAQRFAERVAGLFGVETPLQPVGKTERCLLFKVGNVISVSHGMGMPSMIIFLHEVAKLLVHAGCDLSEVEFVRLGSSGGIGAAPGTVVITKEGYDDRLIAGHEQVTCGEAKRWPAKADPDFIEALRATAEKLEISAVIGNTVGADDFYEGQARLDGALKTWYTEEDKMKFLQRAFDVGVRNMEMECSGYLAFFNRLGAVRAAVMCPTIVDRLKGDQITATPETLQRWMDSTHVIMANYIAAKFPDLCSNAKPESKK